MQRLKQGGLVALAVVSCPCHAVLLLALLAGTGFGAAFAAHSGALVGVLTLVFLGALVGLFRANQTKAAQPAHDADDSPGGPQRAACCTVPFVAQSARTQPAPTGTGEARA